HVVVVVEKRRQHDPEENERRGAEDRPDEDVERLPPLGGLVEREGRVRQRGEAEDQVIAQQDPRGERRPREDRDALALELAEDVVEEDDRRDRVDQVEESGARRQESLQFPLPARRLLAPLVPGGEGEDLGPREDQEEVQEDRREQEQADGSRVLHEDVDPPVGGGAQPADEEEQEEHAEQEEDLRRAVVRAAREHEEADEEEEEPQNRRVEVGRPAQANRGKP